MFGVWRGNYSAAIKMYADRGEVNHLVAKNSHPHNIYFELLVSKGLLGITFFINHFFIFKKYKLGWSEKVRFIVSATVHLLMILIVGLGSEAPLIKNNFVSVFLVYLAVFYSFIEKELKSTMELK